jgi:hypothetical protein
MEAILKFNLPEETHEFKMAIDGSKWSSAMWELDQWLRSETKYNAEALSQEKYDAYCDIRDKIYSILNKDGISFDD